MQRYARWQRKLSQSSPATDTVPVSLAALRVRCTVLAGAPTCVRRLIRCADEGSVVDHDIQDVGLIVLADENTEYLKRLLTEANERFFLVPSRNRNANYEVLWYELPSTRRGADRECKVDILVPGGDLGIPHIPSRCVKRRDGLPVMPPLPLLLMKLQGWTDHRNSNRLDFQEKQHVDVEDIEELLTIVCDMGTHIDSKSMKWLPDDFVSDAQDRVYEFVEEFPRTALEWEALGFQSEEVSWSMW